MSSGAPSPQEPPFQFWRLATATLCGFAIQASRLIQKFRKHLGLGVFANPSAVVFLLLGAALGACTAPLDNVIRHVPEWLQPLVPWFASLSGIGLLGILPRLGPKPAGKTAKGDLPAPEYESHYANFIFEANLELIRESIGDRLDDEVETASWHYGWKEIQTAIERTRRIESAIWPKDSNRLATLVRSVKARKPADDPESDRLNRCQALADAFAVCSFRRLRRNLARAQSPEREVPQ